MKSPGRNIVFVILTAGAALSGCSKVPHYELSRFIDPETCGGCHETIYQQWKNSLHNLSHVDPVYREVSLHDLKNLTDRDEIKEAEHCVACHTPIGFVSGMPAKTSDHVKQIPGWRRRISAISVIRRPARKIYNAEIDLDPARDADPGTKSPYRDSRSDYHVSAYLLFTRGPRRRLP